MLVSRLAYGPALVPLVLAPVGTGPVTVGLFLASQLIIGLAFGLAGPAEMGSRQTVAPDHLQGRVNATIRSANRAVIVVAAPLGGWLADRIGHRPTLWITAVGFTLVAALFARTPAARALLPSQDVESGPNTGVR